MGRWKDGERGRERERDGGRERERERRERENTLIEWSFSENGLSSTRRCILREKLEREKLEIERNQK